MPLSPEDCKSMPDVRAEIDRIDDALVDLIAERFSYVDRAWHLKNSPGEAYVGWRIQQVIDKVKVRSQAKGVPAELAEALWRQMIGWFVQYEEEKLRKAQETFAKGHASRDGDGETG
jgi:isochorismate pyruvate lyase